MVSNKSNYKAIVRILGTISLIIGITMLIPLCFAAATHETAAIHAFGICAPVTIAIGLILVVAFRFDRSDFHSRDGFLIVTLCWLLASLVGMFPYQLSGVTDRSPPTVSFCGRR